MSNAMFRATNFAQYVLKEKILKDNIVVDGTMGNGNDTCFLANLVGPKGKVFSFDVQPIALENTKNKMISNQIDMENIHLINDSHENIEYYIHDDIDAAMFNLGYLPGGDHTIITKPNSTIKSILSILKLLRRGGIISLVIYYGHEGGIQEKDEILNFLEKIPHNEVSIMECSYLNHKNNPPIIIFIEKK